MYTLPSRDIVVQTCRGVGHVLLYYMQNLWERGGWCGISLIYPYLYLLLWARCRKLCVHGVTFVMAYYKGDCFKDGDDGNY